ncbi:unnamed protein product [Meganyctiphanes norvegica]|uniref:Tetraspanin n=1 Tax=Meganyctiphanes norvegica TaxID=48144 RepID=A0AAV2PPC1_MEGNR
MGAITEAKIFKILFCITNLLLFAGAISMVIAMVAIMVQGKEYIDLMGNNSSWIIACTVVGIAIIMVFISCLGCLGAFGQNTCLLKMYIVMISVLMVILVAGGICAWVYKADAIATVEESMQEKMKTYQPGLAEADDGTRVWDVIQETYQCCGINSHLDWSEFHTSYSNAHKRTPDSCKEASVDGNGPLHVDGCLLKVSETIRQNHWSIGGGITGVFLYLLLSICIVCMVIKNMNEDDPLIFQMNERGYDNNAMQVKA